MNDGGVCGKAPATPGLLKRKISEKAYLASMLPNKDNENVFLVLCLKSKIDFGQGVQGGSVINGATTPSCETNLRSVKLWKS